MIRHLRDLIIALVAHEHHKLTVWTKDNGSSPRLTIYCETCGIVISRLPIR